MAEPRLVVLSNRLPVSLQRPSRKRYSARPGHGGLVTALTPVLRERDGIWIGWPGTQVEPEAASALRDEEALEFLARVLIHIPEPHKHLLHFHGA